MAAVTTFPSISASIGTNKDKEYNVKEANFGDGYQQVVTVGLNNIKERWNVKFNNISNTDADTIETFIDARKGAEPFNWTPPNEGSAKQYRHKNFKRTPLNPNQSTITVRFIQAFDL